MSEIKLNKTTLKKIIKESIREVFLEERINFEEHLIPWISEKEMSEIKKSYKKPSKKIAKSVKVNYDLAN